ncbi:hypothetical protein EVAR_69213_1 [Eumeta japonica]|uniref:Uncharacterized protein n=1 Tax=Eumeta variegata TaxID=151549 RepID=A0A4C2A1B3_EUMVA|nr:hypothetical protein EVAR_69213_1 [Eumeta japonica]
MLLTKTYLRKTDESVSLTLHGCRRFEMLDVQFGLEAKSDIGVLQSRDDNSTEDENESVLYKIKGTICLEELSRFIELYHFWKLFLL